MTEVSDSGAVVGPPALRGGQYTPDPPSCAARAELVAALIDAVSARAEILLVAHVHPDADSLGSALALGLALRAAGGRVRVSFDAKPFAVPRTLGFLAGQDLLVDPVLITDVPGLVVCLDADSRPRLGRLGHLAAATRVAVIDHHLSNTGFGDLNLVDHEAPSTSALVVDVIDALGVPLDADMAAAIYAGLVTDTVSFQRPATNPAVHRLAARLLATGIRHDLISRALWDSHRFGCLKLLGVVIDRARLEPEHDLVWTWCGQQDLRRAGVALDEIQGFIDTLRMVSEVEVALICKQEGGAWKVSLRSLGGIDVGALCTGLGGGGHHLAAGFASTAELGALMDEVRAALAGAPRLSSPTIRALTGPDDAAGRAAVPAPARAGPDVTVAGASGRVGPVGRPLGVR
ncbi:DHH family phosphoesterase [Frankia sp. AgKG'84/4]|uniref:DHH family phosphoesterase n=1 Tax=Frankia sp. AgKG'84/4 TaxID=573490 RepID=UPI00200C9107|nr:DHH family phosphoesterase [Frankia sp. AgKG'84/4]MCL9794774.1 DHH family phosphoesterase [Frankia sp. AgKG'84/4]